MLNSMAETWLTLSEVAEWLGVHPSTVRNWADQGRLPVHRTQGGHRRFKQSELDLWAQSQNADTEEEAAILVQSALGYTRVQITEGSLEQQGWYASLDEAARQDYARSGRKLMQALTKYLASDEEEGRGEARAVGYDYARLGRRHDLGVLAATEAYLFFRTALQDAMHAAYEAAAINSPQAWSAMSAKVNAFTDQVLLSLLETYESLRTS
jgi:excisionase family DNA binding protein